MKSAWGQEGKREEHMGWPRDREDGVFRNWAEGKSDQTREWGRGSLMPLSPAWGRSDSTLRLTLQENVALK